MDEITPSCIHSEMISTMLSNLVWGSRLIALCFSCFMKNILKNFGVIAVARTKVG